MIQFPFQGKILAIDPGVMTGMCLGKVEDDDVNLLDYQQVHFPNSEDQARYHVVVANHILDYIEKHDPEVIVIEQFDLRPNLKFLPELTPVKVNAILDYALKNKRNQKTGYPYIVYYQTPAQAKSIITDERLKRLGFWPTGKDVGYKDANDVRDAARHLYRFCVMECKLRQLQNRILGEA